MTFRNISDMQLPVSEPASASAKSAGKPKGIGLLETFRILIYYKILVTPGIT